MRSSRRGSLSENRSKYPNGRKIKMLIIDKNKEIIGSSFTMDVDGTLKIEQLKEDVRSARIGDDCPWQAFRFNVFVPKVGSGRLTTLIPVHELKENLRKMVLNDEKGSDAICPGTEQFVVNQEVRGEELMILQGPFTKNDVDSYFEKSRRQTSNGEGSNKRRRSSEEGRKVRPKVKFNPETEAEALWDYLWHHRERHPGQKDQVPLCERYKVERGKRPEKSITVPEECWIFKAQENSTMLQLPPKGAMIRNDYVEALNDLKDLFTTNDEIDQSCRLDEENGLKNPFLSWGETTECGGFVLTGHPGIGKSTWLRLLLVLRLHAQLPTFFQIDEKGMHYFDSTGVQRIQSTEFYGFKSVIKDNSKPWVLVDSTKHLTDVDTILANSGLFIVQTPSPRKFRLEWINKKNGPKPLLWFLKPFTLSELIMGRGLQATKRSEYELKTFFNTYGPSARSAYEDDWIQRGSGVDRLCGQLDITTLGALANPAMVDLELEDAPENISHRIVVVYPDNASRSLWVVKFASDEILDKILSSLANKSATAIAELFRMFKAGQPTRIVAGYLFEKVVKGSAFVKPGQWRVYHLGKGQKKEKNWIWRKPDEFDENVHSYLTITQPDDEELNLRIGKWDDGQEQSEGEEDDARALPCIDFSTNTGVFESGRYMPLNRNQATFDWFLYDRCQSHAVIFQVTVAGEHGIKLAGLTELSNLGIRTLTMVIIRPATFKAKKLKIWGPKKVQSHLQDIYVYHFPDY